jgi:hypothetical protein
MAWRRYTEEPETRGPITALVALYDDEDGTPYLAGIYVWKNGDWRNEETGALLLDSHFAWNPEDEAVAGVPAFA